MASTCINNITYSPETFPACSPPHSKWRLTVTGEMPQQKSSDTNNLSDLPEKPDLESSDIGDFEFRLSDPVTMLPADELFFDGKLFPLHFPVVRHEPISTSIVTTSSEVSSLDPPEPRRIINGVSVVDAFLYSPKAPKCSSKWKELLNLKKLYQNSNNKTTSSPSTGNGNRSGATKSIKQFLNRSSKSSNDSSVNLPLLNDTDNEPPLVTSRHSLSSSSSGHDQEDIPRLSLDSDKQLKVNMMTNPNPGNPPRVRLVKTRTLSNDGSVPVRSVSIDSPRMNSSGKIVFHSLDRSSSSPSTFNGGPRFKYKGMERSYSANVRITPVLNVPIYSKSGNVFGLPLFSSSSALSHKQDGTSGSNRGSNRTQQIHIKSKTDRS
ncbi:uncharacterized protein [Rutidosis leptorrhynchoides]|uniref:uncharacterized protein n=1 Tax=Rutidosis leptorrhynchoides TaxID=125765 RepID=UPI003A99B5C0